VPNVTIVCPRTTRNNNYVEISSETLRKVINLRTEGEVVIHFVLDTKGQIKEISAVKGLRLPGRRATDQSALGD
jgi:hypothetical protein